MGNIFFSTADSHRSRASRTGDKRGVFTPCPKSASPSRITQSFCEVSSQSRLSSCGNHTANLAMIAGCDGHNSNNDATLSLCNRAAGHLQSTRGHSHATNLTGLSALGHHVTNQTQGDLVMQRYLSETDRYKEFLLGSQDDRSQNSPRRRSTLEEWNYRWNESIPPRENNHSNFLASSRPKSHTDQRHRKTEAVIYPNQVLYCRRYTACGLASVVDGIKAFIRPSL